MTWTLLQLRFRELTNRAKLLSMPERIIGLLLFISGPFLVSLLVRGYVRNLQMTMSSSLGEGAIEAGLFRFGILNAAFLSFISYQRLWHSPDRGILDILPFRPRHLVELRAIQVVVESIPIWFGTAAGLLLSMENPTGLSMAMTFVHLAFTVLGTVISSLLCHLFAGYSVVYGVPDWAKEMLAGKMVHPDRTLLLYSPLMGAGLGYATATLWLTTINALGPSPTVIAASGTVVMGCLWFIWRITLELADRYYYPALSSLGDAERSDWTQRHQDKSDIFSENWLHVLPSRLRSYAIKDLTQLIRQSRISLFFLGTCMYFPVVVTLFGLVAQHDSAVLPVLMILTASAGGPLAFLLARPQVDSPLCWAMLPASFCRQLVGRYTSVLLGAMLSWPALFALVLLFPPFLLKPLLLGLLVSLQVSLIGVNVALTFFTRRGVGVTVYAVMVGTLLLAGQEFIGRAAILGLLWLVVTGVQVSRTMAMRVT